MAEIALQLGIPVICTTYDIHSELAKRSSVVIDKMSYEEASYIETKGYIASLTIFFLCILETAYAYGKLSQGEYEQWISDFEKLPAACEDLSLIHISVASSQYWNSVHGRSANEALQDDEGLQTMRTLARNMAFLMKSIELGKAAYGLPVKEAAVHTHFIR